MGDISRLNAASPGDRSQARLVMARDVQGKHILDTSAWNKLFDDLKRDQLLQKLRTTVVVPTTLAICELAATKDPERRQALVRLVKTVGRNNRPLLMPNQLMIFACRGYARRDPVLTLNGGGEAEGAWFALNNPALLDAEARRLTLKFNTERETIFRRCNEGLRKALQANFSNGVERPHSMSALIRHFGRNDDLIYDFVNSIYERAVGRALPRDELRPLINSLPHWPMFLMSYVCAIYQRAVQEQGFGHNSNPGNLDLWSATYLPSCETFITHDTRQRRALKVINRNSARPARILPYMEWREKLLQACEAD
ncbi:MAG: hypothetical protein P4K98_03560 [Bryobacteraceae bacterium]|nr:hypothetical protein [Bryobacteraceae bacterium]